MLAGALEDWLGPLGIGRGRWGLAGGVRGWLGPLVIGWGHFFTCWGHWGLVGAVGHWLGPLEFQTVTREVLPKSRVGS